MEEPTGIADITLINGDADYTFNSPCSWDVIPLPSVDFPKEVDLIYFGTLAQRSPISRETLNTLLSRVEAKEVFYDVNIRKDFYSEKYSGDFKKDVESLATSFGLKYVIVTKGGDGSVVFGNGRWSEVGVEQNLKVVDTVGAGDSLSAGFCHTLFLTGDAKKALIVGSKIAGFVVTRKGAMPEYPEALINSLRE